MLNFTILKSAKSEEGWGERDSNYQWRLCPATQSLPTRPQYSDRGTDPKETEIRAENSRLTEGEISHFSGEVEVIRGERSIAAEVVTYDPRTKTFNAEGRAHIWDAGVLWAGETASYDLENRVSLLRNGRFWNKNGMGRGSATKIVNNRITQKTDLENIEYSTCPFENEFWRLSASALNLNHLTDRGTAKHAVLFIKDTPVFYFPIISFPISDERKSGFLSPAIGNSTESGFVSQIPYYWNIAADKDATVTPRFMSKRGVLFDTEFRYLDKNYEGETIFQIMPGDDLKNGDNRSYLSVDHQHWFGGGKYYLKVDFNNVSDDEFFTDLSTGTANRRSFMEQFVDLRYLGNRQSIYVNFRNYQSVDDTIPSQFGPYKQLPSISYWLNGPGFGKSEAAGSVNLALAGNFINYERGNSLTGNILSLRPNVSYNYFRPFLNVRTKLEIQHNQYFLDDPNRVFDDNESYTVPKFSIDSQLFSERNIVLGETSFLQTLEPRIFYLLIPNTDFDHIPNFSSGIYDNSNFSNIFSENRFGGFARVGDANQVTAAVTSRLIDRLNGREKLRFSMGQIYYFRDRKVTLPGGAIDREDTSELLVETIASPTNAISLRGNLKWDPDKGRASKAGISLRYQPNMDTVFNLRYRHRKSRSTFQPDIRQTDLSARIPIGENLALIGRWNYSLEEKTSMETFGGIEFESCCWGAKIVARRFLKDSDGIHDNSIFMQIHFRGLGGFGRGGSESFISSGISGYNDPFE
ncbi:MAG: LPS assembly protein LptD [Pseudomonadota bacterium]|nr:LPS assembly protein LptD [Pseudomonadota bacterium]